MYVCYNCGKTFTRESNLNRHIKESCRKYGEEEHKQSKIPRIENRPSTSRMNAVPSSSSSREMVMCNCCGKAVRINAQVSHRRTLQHRTNACVDYIPNVQLIQSAFKSRVASYRIQSENRCNDYDRFFESIKNQVISLLSEVITVHKIVKVNMELFARYILQTQEIADIKSFNTPNKVIDCATDLNEAFNMFMDFMITQMSDFEERDSGMVFVFFIKYLRYLNFILITGWALEHVMFLEVNVNKFNSLKGSSYMKLPKFIEVKKAVVNVHNQDECCFLWAITSALYPAQRRTSDMSSYPHYSTVLDIEGMTFPVKLQDIPKFELKNNISVNVYTLESKFQNDRMIYDVVGPLYYSQKKLRVHVNLLLITDDDGNSHYCWIKNLSRLVSSQLSTNGHKKYFCDGCLLYFGSERLLLKHQQNDCNHLYTLTPSTEVKIDKFGSVVPGNILKFEHYEKKMEVPFVIYVDFESILKPIDTCEPNPQYSYSNRTFSHEPYSFAYIIKCSFDDSLSKFELYRGPNAANVFIKKVEDDLTRIYHNYLKRIVPMEQLSPEEEEQLMNTNICGICEKPLGIWGKKVKDHCHLTGKVRSIAHETCNLHYKIPNFVPIICHNMSGYDCHMFIKELFMDQASADVIAQSKEKYISFTKYLHVEDYVNERGSLQKIYLKLRFIDSFKFMASSLQTLGENLREDLFYETKKHFPNESKFRLMRRKGVFPYSFVNSLDNLNFEELPSKEQFYNTLTEEHITDADYERAKEVWRLFGCRTLGEYSDIYLKSDVLLLCDVFQNFRKMCFNNYKLDPAQYFTAPGLAWDAMLKLTNVELELLTDIDMIHMLKKGIRGGISQCSERKHIANNIFLPKYNPDEESSFIMYLDATNLYGHSMSQILPTSGFTWLTENEIAALDIMQIQDDSPHGFILEVDVDYPQELHDMHSDLPFLVENIIPPNSKSKLNKLIPNLNDKRNYVVHYKNLQQAIQNGLVLRKIHRVLKFNQSRWLKKYIDLNTNMRNKAENKFEKDFYKLMNNAVFGKTMENVENRRHIRLITHWEKIGNKTGARELIARPNFKSCSVFAENFVAIHLGALKILYDKPIYVGFSILELSKTVLYDFFYNTVKRHFGSNASLLYTDTDSLIIKVYTENFYTFIAENADKFDTSNYKPGNKFNVPVNRSVLGKMKDEFPADPIICFYGTGAKAYYVQSTQNELKKAKGIKQNVIKRQLTINDYQKIVERGGLIFRKMNTFTTYLHNMYTEMKNKVALSHNDDKRFIIPNTAKTLAWGHTDIPFYQTSPEENLKFLINALDEIGYQSNVTNLENNLIDVNNFCRQSFEEEPSLPNIENNSIDLDDFFHQGSADQNLEALLAAIEQNK